MNFRKPSIESSVGPDGALPILIMTQQYLRTSKQVHCALLPPKVNGNGLKAWCSHAYEFTEQGVAFVQCANCLQKWRKKSGEGWKHSMHISGCVLVGKFVCVTHADAAELADHMLRAEREPLPFCECNSWRAEHAVSPLDEPFDLCFEDGSESHVSTQCSTDSSTDTSCTNSSQSDGRTVQQFVDPVPSEGDDHDDDFATGAIWDQVIYRGRGIQHHAVPIELRRCTTCRTEGHQALQT